MRSHIIRLMLCVLLSGMLTQVHGQSNSGQGYAYFGLHAASHVGFGDLLSAGAGGEAFAYRGLAFGGDIGYIFPRSSAADGIGLLALNPSYHFVNSDRTNRMVPFVTAGYALGFRSGTANLVNFGGGLTFWCRDRLGLRFEVRNFRDMSADFTTQFRFALTFR